MARPWGSGRLSLAAQDEIIQAVKLRNSLRDAQLAKRFKVSKSSIKSFIRRMYKKRRVELGFSEPTGGVHG
jgi:transposase